MAIFPQGGAQNVSFLTPQQKKQRQQIWVLAVVMAAIAGVLYFGFFRGSSDAPPARGPENFPGADVGAENSPASGREAPFVLSLDIVDAIRQLSAGKLLSQDKRFSGLIIHGQFPIVVGEKGRENPFEAF